MSVSERLEYYKTAVESELDRWLPLAKIQPPVLHEAMRYSVFSDGKRIRPILLYATGEAFGLPLRALNGPACAVEIVHAYSLIHDDLPAMDDDDLRRGRPTCHKKYDEAMAILAGDALQALAFYIIAHDPHIGVNAEQRLEMIKILTHASGSQGMAGGQAIDLNSVGKQLSLQELENMHNHKTGALIGASVKLGALSAMDVNHKHFDHISQYAEYIGLAFQIKDDILDVESDTETLGKPQGSDRSRNKPTYPNLLGLDGAKRAAEELYQKALASLESLDMRANILREIAGFIVHREK